MRNLLLLSYIQKKICFLNFNVLIIPTLGTQTESMKEAKQKVEDKDCERHKRFKTRGDGGQTNKSVEVENRVI